LPRRSIPTVVGKDMGSGIIETWHEPNMDAMVHFTMNHSLVESDGIYIHYMVWFDRKDIDYADQASKARRLLDSILENLGLEFKKEESKSS